MLYSLRQHLSLSPFLTTCALFKHPRSEHISICSITIVPAHVPAFVEDIPPISFRFMFAINQLEYEYMQETGSGSINYSKLKENSN